MIELNMDLTVIHVQLLTSIDEQSGDIAMGVDEALETRAWRAAEDEVETVGAGDQGMMFGYAY